MSKGPCVKQVVKCTIIDIYHNNITYVGTNYCENAQTVCPRGDSPTGVGYEKCRDICQQVGHAEEVAIQQVPGPLKDAIALLEGHTYACDKCKQALRDIGVTKLYIKTEL